MSKTKIARAISLLPTAYAKLPISIIFVGSVEMKRLNSEFRKVDEATDVLSFNIDDDSNEVYICPSYIYRRYRGGKFMEEILRMIVHGILHIHGLDHIEKFDILKSDSEDMFKKQEEILNNIIGK